MWNIHGDGENFGITHGIKWSCLYLPPHSEATEKVKVNDMAKRRNFTAYRPVIPVSENMQQRKVST